MGSVDRLFSTYASAHRPNYDGKSDGLSEAGKNQSALSKIVFTGGNEAKLIKRGNGIMGRAVCWLEDNVFSLFHQLKLRESDRDKKNIYNFSDLVGNALTEVGANKTAKSTIITQVNRHLRNRKPLRREFVDNIRAQIETAGTSLPHGGEVATTARAQVELPKAEPEHARAAEYDKAKDTETANARENTERVAEATGPSAVSNTAANIVAMEIFDKAVNIDLENIENELFPNDDPRHTTRNEFHTAFKKAADNAVQTIVHKGEEQYGPNLITRKNLQDDINKETERLFGKAPTCERERFKLAQKAQEKYANAVKEHNLYVKEYYKKAEEDSGITEPKLWNHEREFHKVVDKCAQDFEGQVTTKLARLRLVDLTR